jgi:DNA-directed RNA polymerase subunit beta'
MVHDANYLYHDVLEASKNWSEHQKEFGNAGDAYLNLYNSAKAVAGVADPVDPKHAEQGIRGMLRFAIGVKDSPKFSRFQRKVLGNTVDTIGRSVITVDPAMDMDSIGIPEEMAWKQFRPFVIARLVRSGMHAADAVKAVKNKSKQAEHALETEMSERPVVYNRAPELHRYNYVGGIAHINRGQSDISISQAVTKGLGADFDGDAIGVHVPVSKEAVNEVKAKLFPSKNLLAANSFDVHLAPSNEFLGGLYTASQKDHKKPTRVFATASDAMAAYTRGEIGVSDPVQIISDK